MKSLISVDKKHAIYGLMAEFDNPGDLVHATNESRKRGFKEMDAYSPYPIEELADAIGFHKHELPMIVLTGGILGLLSGYFMQYFISAVDYPLNIGGRPFHSWVAFIPVSFECTILLAAFSAVFGMLALNGLPTPYHPVFNSERFALATRDRFFLCIESKDPLFNREETANFLKNLKAKEVSEVAH